MILVYLHNVFRENQWMIRYIFYEFLSELPLYGHLYIYDLNIKF